MGQVERGGAGVYAGEAAKAPKFNSELFNVLFFLFFFAEPDYKLFSVKPGEAEGGMD